MERKQIFGVILGVIVCIVMLFAGLYLTGQIGKKKNVVPAAAEVQTTETTDTTMTAAETTAETTTVTTTTTAQSAESLSAAEKERLHTIYGEKMTGIRLPMDSMHTVIFPMNRIWHKALLGFGTFMISPLQIMTGRKWMYWMPSRNGSQHTFICLWA